MGVKSNSENTYIAFSNRVSMKIKISISDDHVILAETLKRYLSDDEHFEVLACYTNSSDTIHGIQRKTPDVLLLDLSMPEKDQDSTCLVTGLDVLAYINTNKLPVKVIVLSNFENYSFVKSSIKQGASGYLLKNEQPEFLRNAIVEVFNHKTVFSSSIRKKLDYLDQADNSNQLTFKLSSRERDILELVSKGFKTADIAKHLSLHKDTVSDYRNVLMKKFQAENAPHLIRLAAQWNVLKLD